MRATLRPGALSTLKWTGSLARLSWQNIVVILFIVCNLATAFALVYAKDVSRRMFIEYQSLQANASVQTNNWSKLLLEQSTWSAQSRVANIATTRLDMVSPRANDVVIVNETE